MTRRLPPLPEPFPGPFRELLPQLLARAGRLAAVRDPARRGRRRALEQSGTFAGHRPYAQGDDLRRIDWNVYARTNELFVKLLEDEEHRSAVVWVDVSPSMMAGAVPRLCAALRLAAILGGVALQQFDAVRVQAGGGAQLVGRDAVTRLLARLDDAGRGVAFGDADPDPRGIAAGLARFGSASVHWISDFAAPEPVERALHLLRRAGCRVVGWLPEIDEDHDVPASGWTRVVDPETGGELVVAVDTALAAAMQAELQRLRQQQRRAFAAAGFPLQRLRLPHDDFSLPPWLEATWLSRR